MDKLFEKATRKKLRFDSPMGRIGSEDLWDLSLEHLDEVARGLSKKLKDEDVSFIGDAKPTKDRSEDELRFEIVKRVIEVKLADWERAEKAAATRAKKQRILELLEEKQDESLKEKSEDELRELLEDM